jgi:uncharacterized protein
MEQNKNIDRITNLDFIRGIAVLGILIMNAVMFVLPKSAYYNPSSAGTDNILDWIFVAFSQIFVAEKMMGLFSLLFGASIVLFIESLKRRNSKYPHIRSIWRNLILLIVGIIHLSIWFGDVLILYALCAPIVLLLYRMNRYFILILGVLFINLPVIFSIIFQPIFDSQGNLIMAGWVKDFVISSESETSKIGLGQFWFADKTMTGDLYGIFILIDAFGRALGMMLIGVFLYRSNILQGIYNNLFYRKMAIIGFAIGIPLATSSLIWGITKDYNPSIALSYSNPHRIANLPLVLGYVGLLTLLNTKLPLQFVTRIRAVGKMALTNYLTQTLISTLIFTIVFPELMLSRSGLMLYIVAIWVLQIYWSKYWLDHFQYGPFEWVWRKCTYITIKAPIRLEKEENF